MIFLMYNILLVALSPLLLVYFSIKSVTSDKYRGTMDERYGHYDHELFMPGYFNRVWIHAVSVGEVVGAAPLIRTITDTLPGIELVVSSTTKAGREIFKKTFGSSIRSFYFPFDLPWVVHRAMDTVQPDVLVLMETEIWPNVIAACIKKQIPVLLLNGRVSDRMAGAGPIVRALYKWAFTRMSAIGVQTETDAKRIIALGAPENKVTVVGNMKFDGLMSAPDRGKIAALEAEFNPGGERMTFVAGSTHPGEEELILDAFEAARREFPGMLLVIAPRHIERADTVKSLAEARNLTTALRTEAASPLPRALDVLVLNTIGELRYLYAISTACFVGGSLIERGGHNVLEPAACGKAPFYGPHTANFRDSVLALEHGLGGRPVKDGADLSSRLTACLADGAARARTDARALEVLISNSGATNRALDLLKKYI